MIKINLNKAKEITRARLRAESIPLLEKLDVDFFKALERGTDTTEIIKEKERLRNITTLVDTIDNLEELKKLTAEKPNSEQVPKPVNPINPEQPIVSISEQPIEPPKSKLGNLIIRID